MKTSKVSEAAFGFYAFSLGYYCGRLRGKSLNFFKDEADTLKILYRQGYNTGVLDYNRAKINLKTEILK